MANIDALRSDLWRFLLGLALLAGCTSSAQTPTSPATVPTTPFEAAVAPEFEQGWLEASIIERLDPQLQQGMRREREPLPVRTVVFADDEIRLSGEATGPPIVQNQEGGFYEVVFPLGIEGEMMTCFVYPSNALNLGAAVHTVHAEIVAAVGKVFVLGVRAGVEEGRPFLVADSIYRFTDDQGPKLGVSRIAAGSAWGSTLLCALDMPGMRNSFIRMFRTSLRSFQDAGAQLPTSLRYRDLYVHDGGDWAAGYVENVVVDVDAGSAILDQYSGRLYRSKKGELGSWDYASSEESRAGRVHAISAVALTDGETEYALEVAVTPDTEFGYRVKGDAFGEQVSSAFTVDGGLEDQASFDVRVAELMRSNQANTDRGHVFSPSRNPRQSTEVTMTKLHPPRAEYNLLYTFTDTGTEILTRVNDKGRTLSARYEMSGGLPIRVTQVYAEGVLQ